MSTYLAMSWRIFFCLYQYFYENQYVMQKLKKMACVWLCLWQIPFFTLTKEEHHKDKANESAEKQFTSIRYSDCRDLGQPGFSQQGKQTG